MGRLTAQAEVHTGAMVALVPAEEDAVRLAVADYEPVDELHLTLGFLGEADNWAEPDRLQLVGRMAEAAQYMKPFDGMAFARATFNPTTNPCACYIVGGTELTPLHNQVWMRLEQFEQLLPPQHLPWVAHVAIGYGLDDDRLLLTGLPIHFDRLRVAFAGENVDLPLG